ncbi:MAG TPA: response regulator [Pirellulales bacterium]|nr:response regulator [Pirellulales bacterium]
MATSSSPLRVLVLDDHRDTVDSMSLLLSWWGHQPHLAHGGSPVVEQALTIKPDLMLVDMATPRWDGLSLARQLRREVLLAAMRLVGVTAGDDESQRGRALEAGFDELLVKPVAAHDLRGLIVRVQERISVTQARVLRAHAVARETRDLNRRVKERHGIVRPAPATIALRIEKSGISRLVSAEDRAGADDARNWLRAHGCRVGPLFETGAEGQTGFFVYSRRLGLRELFEQNPLFQVR